jgi:toxin CcdB
VPQFTVYRNKSSRSKSTFPFLVDVQSDLLEQLQTRVVIPLTRTAGVAKRPLSELTPALAFDGDSYVLMTPQLAGVARSELGAPAGSLAGERNAIIAAMDFLLLGLLPS